MIKDDPAEVVVHVEAPAEERFEALDAILAAMPEASLLLFATEDGTHLAANNMGEKGDPLVPLVMIAVTFLLAKWKETIGEAGAERLFALFVSELAQRNFPPQVRRTPGLN